MERRVSDPAEVSDEILLLCGYVRVHQVLVGDGQSVSFNLINGWARITVSSEDLGGEGSALGATKQVTVWAAPGEKKTDHAWRYDLTIQVSGDEMFVAAMKSSSNPNDATHTRTGTLVALDPPTPMEMLAAQARHMEGYD